MSCEVTDVFNVVRGVCIVSWSVAVGDFTDVVAAVLGGTKSLKRKEWVSI